ncbi:MAG: DNA polymerase/3'-5' exonuclease PolX [Gammaproteobacteria bacterium]|nr:MAG: DNA polymerase/3'-5' exonuclease PolX [Gammaproteobacteria bacterium]
MPVHNADVATVFEEIADLLEIENANPFRVRAYRNAARLIGDLNRELSDMLAGGADLTELPGIGADLAGKIQEIVTTGKSAMLVKLRKRTPPALIELLKLPGLGPKKVKTLYQELDIHSIEQLARAARDGRIRNVHGFGARSEAKILEAVAAQAGSAGRFKLAAAAQYAERLVAYLKAAPGVSRVIVAGSFRRCKETVGDLDILVTAKRAAPVMERFVSYDEVAEILAQGTTRATVLLRSKLQVDVRVVAEESYGAALHYFTGSKSHNIALRKMGQEMGLKINEYGVFRGKRRIAGATEESVYASVGLPYIEPELRENRGEIEAARGGRLPKLVEFGDLRGDLHAHTRATDGRNTVREMAEAAKARGLEYLAITEHSRRLTVARGLTPQRLLAQMDEIDRLNAELKGVTLLKGIEVDILEDGALDLPDDLLGRLDVVVAAVHSRFDLSRDKQTARILKAMDHPHFSILAHPSGRLIEQREPYDVDMPRLIRHARERGCFLEINAQPDRLDLLDIYIQMAKEEGVLLAVSSDAHSVQQFDYLRFGIGQARRGWLEKDDVVNTRPLKELRALLSRTL